MRSYATPLRCLPLVAALLASGSVLMACSDGGDGPESSDDRASQSVSPLRTLAPPTLTPSATSPSTPIPTPSSSQSEPPVVRSDVPAELVGTWSSIDSGKAQLYYRFSPDGTFEFLGAFADPQLGVDYTVEAVGTLTVTPTALELEPVEARRTEGGSAPEPISMPPSSVPWQITPEDVLILETEFGTMDFARES
jgi:hypothetical protein